VKDKWYGDKHDLAKWGVLLHLASRRYGASMIVQVVYYRPETIETDGVEIDGVVHPMPDAVIRHFRNVMDIARLSTPGVHIEVFGLPISSRDAYFEEAQAALIANLASSPNSPCIIFLDPDTGLEPPRSKPGLEHVLESELSQIWETMRGSDVLVFYQHGPRKKDTSWTRKRLEQFENALGLSHGAAKVARGEAAKDVVFFFAQKPL